jgi:ParB family transcriptional regulator, chromosome partitioning protein
MRIKPMAEDGKFQNKKIPNLGRGLSALFGDTAEDYAAIDKLRQNREIDIDLLTPNRFQPRKTFSDDSLEELANSIRERGVLQPILVRRLPEDPNRFEIIAGERRWRAAQRAKLYEVPAIVRDMNDQQMAEAALIENIQRQDLNVIEEALAYRRLMEEFSYSQEELGRYLSKSRSHVANILRLLTLPEAIQELLINQKISAGHARALIGYEDAQSLAERIVEEGLSVRTVEKIVQLPKGEEKFEKTSAPQSFSGKTQQKVKLRDPNIVAIERKLSEKLGLNFIIENKGEVGRIIIEYQSLDQFEEVINKLGEEVF